MAKEPNVTGYTVQDIVTLMREMNASRVAYIEVPGVLRLGILPEPKGSSTANARPEVTPEQAMRMVARQQEEHRRQRLERSQDRKDRLAASMGGISASGGKTIANLADELAREASTTLTDGLPGTGTTSTPE